MQLWSSAIADRLKTSTQIMTSDADFHIAARLF
jgi:hypothetical protein